MGTRLLCLLLAFCFIAAVFAYGTGLRYDPWTHFQKIVYNFENVPSLESIVEYWTKDEWVVVKERVFESSTTTYAAPGGGASGGAFGVYFETVRPEHVTDGSWGVFDPVKDFFGAVKGFFVRMYYTIKWVVDVISFAFRMVAVIAPWNGYVKEGI